jgi:hypothetical protein
MMIVVVINIFPFIQFLNPPCPPFFKGGTFLTGRSFASKHTILPLLAMLGSPFVKGDRGIFLAPAPVPGGKYS